MLHSQTLRTRSILINHQLQQLVRLDLKVGTESIKGAGSSFALKYTVLKKQGNKIDLYMVLNFNIIKITSSQNLS